MRIRMLFAVAAMAAGVPLAAMAQQNYPSKTLKWVVAFPAGNSTDVLGRIVADKVASSTKQTVVIENHGGGNAIVGSAIVARAPADGYTVLIASNSVQSAAPYLTKNLPFDPNKDLIAVAMLGVNSPLMLVPSTSPANSVTDFVALAKKNPGKLKAGSPNTISQFAVEQLKMAAGIDIVIVQYKAAQQMMNDLSTGQLDLVFTGVPPSQPYIQNKTVKAIAVTSKARIPNFPDVPTVAETYPGFLSIGWIAASVPAGTSPEIVNKLNAEINKALALSDVKEKLGQLSYDIMIATPQELRAYIDADVKRWGEVTKAANWQPE